MGKLKEISGATLNYGIGKVIPQLIGFFLIPVYTVYLTPADYGIVELGGSFLGFVVIFMRMALPGSISRFYFEHKEGPELRNYVTTIYWSLMVLSITVACIAMVISYFFINTLVPGLPFWPFIIILLVTGTLNTNSDIQKRLIQARKQSKYSALLSIITALVSILLAIFFVVVLELKSLGFILAGLISACLFFIQAQVYLKKDLGGQFSFKLIKPSVKYAMNIVPSHLVMPFSNLFSRSLLASYSISALGTFSLASRCVLPLMIVAEAFNTSFHPIYYETRKQNDGLSLKRLNETLKNIWIACLIIFTATALFFPPIIKLLTPSSYHQASELIPYMALTFPLGILTYFVQAEVFYSKKTFWVTIYATFKIIINLSLSYFAINYWEIYGMVIVLVGDAVYATIFWIIVSNHIHKIKFKFDILIKSGAITILLASLIIIFNHFYSQLLLQLSAAIILFVVYLVSLVAFKWVDLNMIKNIILKKKQQVI